MRALLRNVDLLAAIAVPIVYAMVDAGIVSVDVAAAVAEVAVIIRAQRTHKAQRVTDGEPEAAAEGGEE